MFKTDNFLFLSDVTNIKQAKESVNECKRIVENINEIVVNNKPFYNTCKNAIYDGINLINNIDVAIENVKKSLVNLDSSRLTSKIKFSKLDDSSTVVTNDTYNIDCNSLNAGGFSSTNKQSASKKFDMHETLLSDYGIKDSIFSSNLRVKKVLENSKEEYDENSLNMIWYRYTKKISALKKVKPESSSKFSAKYPNVKIEIDTTLEEKKYLKELLAELNSNGYKIEDLKKFVCASGEEVYINSSANTKEKVNVWNAFITSVNEIYEQDKLERRNQFLNNGYTLMDIFEKYYDMNEELEKQMVSLKEKNNSFYDKYPEVYNNHRNRITEELYKQLELELYNAGYSFEEAYEYAKKIKYDSLENLEKKGVEFFIGINAFVSGIGEKVESVVDGAIYLVGMPVVWGIGLFGDDVNTKMVEQTIKDIVGRDFSNDMYIDLVDPNKELPTDELYGNSYKEGSTIADFVGTIGISILATPLAVSSGFLSGVGETAEIGINNGDSNWATYLKSLVNGVSTASEVYSYNKMISGIKNFVSSGTLKKLGKVSLENIKNISSSGFKNIGKNVFDFSINNLKTLPSTLGKSFLTTVTDTDMLVETGCMLLDNVISGIEKGNFNFDEALGNVGFVFLVNYAMNFASSISFGSKMKNEDYAFSKIVGMENSNSKLNLKNVKTMLDSNEYEVITEATTNYVHKLSKSNTNVVLDSAIAKYQSENMIMIVDYESWNIAKTRLESDPNFFSLSETEQNNLIKLKSKEMSANYNNSTGSTYRERLLNSGFDQYEVDVILAVASKNNYNAAINAKYALEGVDGIPKAYNSVEDYYLDLSEKSLGHLSSRVTPEYKKYCLESFKNVDGNNRVSAIYANESLKYAINTPAAKDSYVLQKCMWDKQQIIEVDMNGKSFGILGDRQFVSPPSNSDNLFKQITETHGGVDVQEVVGAATGLPTSGNDRLTRISLTIDGEVKLHMGDEARSCKEALSGGLPAYEVDGKVHKMVEGTIESVDLSKISDWDKIDLTIDNFDPKTGELISTYKLKVIEGKTCLVLQGGK